MADNSQLDFRLKIYALELNSAPITMAQPSTITSPPPPIATTTTVAIEVATAAVSVADYVTYVTRTIDTFNICRNDIDYRAEGNANIVLAMPQRCQVLRLPKKSKSKQNICHSTAEEECWRNERIFYVYKYIDRVSTLFGPNTSSRPILVRIEFCNVDAFDIWLHNHRPMHRKRSQGDGFDFDYGLLYHDACSLNLNLESTSTAWADVLAVEIKPKQGWNICALPEWLLLDLFEINHGVRNKCRFCAMQHLKVKGRQVHRISKYCPLDLFSGDTARMNKSIRNLIASPQNNFRLFRNGQLIYSDDYQEHALQSALSPCFGHNSNAVDAFISLLVNILLHDFSTESHPNFSQPDVLITDTATDENHDTHCMLQSSSHLSKHSILKRVLDLQLLAKKTIPYVAQKYVNESNGWEHLISNEQWSYAHISDLCKKLSRSDPNAIDVIDYEYLKSAHNLNDEEIYEIGATALDASIMVTFSKSHHQTNDDFGHSLFTLNDQQFVVNTTVFDLDPKLYPRHFTKYVRKTRDSFNAYRKHLNA